MERKDDFYFLSFTAFLQRILAWNAATTVFFNFFVFFLEFSVTHRVGMKRNDNFSFLSFPAFSSLFWLKMKPQWYFFNFFNFFVIFLEFSVTPRVRMERKDNFYFLSFTAFLQRILAWNEATTVFFNFFGIFLEFSITHWVGTKWNDNFYFLSFPVFSILFWLIMKPQRYFFIFWIFLPFFGIFYHASCRNGREG